MTSKTSFGTQLAPRILSWGALKGCRGSKLKLKDIWHLGCLFSTILVKEVVIDFKDIFWDPTSPPGPFFGRRGALKGSRGSKLKLQDIWHVVCIFITILVKEDTVHRYDNHHMI